MPSGKRPATSGQRPVTTGSREVPGTGCRVQGVLRLTPVPKLREVSDGSAFAHRAERKSRQSRTAECPFDPPRRTPLDKLPDKERRDANYARGLRFAPTGVKT